MARPRILEDTVKITVSLDSEVVEYLRALGEGNVSLGIRRLAAPAKVVAQSIARPATPVVLPTKYKAVVAPRR